MWFVFIPLLKFNVSVHTSVWLHTYIYIYIILYLPNVPCRYSMHLDTVWVSSLSTYVYVCTGNSPQSAAFFLKHGGSTHLVDEL